MKNIVEILKGLGIEVSEDKVADLNKEVAENYKTVAEHEKKIAKLENERDGYRDRAENAEGTLKDFEGKDFESITKERDEWKVKFDNLVREQQEKADKEELDNALADAIKNAKGLNAKAIIANLDMDAIKNSKNRDTDIQNAIKALSESDETKFLFATDPENNRAHFTQPKAQSNNGSAVTKESIMAIKDRTERINAIAQNRELFSDFK